MINQPWHYDKCDKVQLCATMLKFATTPDDEGNNLLDAPDYGVIEDLAELATQLLPGLIWQGAKWDGAAWLQRLENAEEESLAHWLLNLLNDGEAPANLADMVEYTLLEWARRRGIGLRSHNLADEPLTDRLAVITEEARDAGYAITWWSPEEVKGVNVKYMLDTVVSRGNDFIEDTRGEVDEEEE